MSVWRAGWLCLMFHCIDHCFLQHDSDVVHRDIKAENVFVKESVIKLGDFGFSTTASASTLLTSFCGSPLYAAPELFTADHYLGQPVDMWACGVTLYFVLTGRMPFPGRRLDVVREGILEGQFSLPDHLTPACQALLRGLLSADVSRRLSVKEVLGSAWLRGVESTPTNHASLERSEDCSRITPLLAESECLDLEVVEDLRTIGLPVQGVDFSEEPRSSTVGTYRILLHRKQRKACEDQQVSCSPDHNVEGRNKGVKRRRRKLSRLGEARRITSTGCQQTKSSYCTIL